MSRANLSVFEASSASKFTEFAANVNFLSLRNLASNELFFTVLYKFATAPSKYLLKDGNFTGKLFKLYLLFLL